jgi:acetyl esterase/lipase
MYPFLDTHHVDPEEAQTSVEVIEEYSPLRALEVRSGPVPAMFIARAGRDSIPGVNESIARFLDVALERNVAVEFFNHPTGAHGFDQRNDDARSRTIIRELLRFLQENLVAEK